MDFGELDYPAPEAVFECPSCGCYVDYSPCPICGYPFDEFDSDIYLD